MSLCIIQFSSVEGIKHSSNLDDEQSKEERQIELEAGIDTNSYVQNQLDEYFRSHVARWFMKTLRKINMIAAPPLWFVEIFLLFELAYLSPHLHWLTPCCFLLAVLWLLTNVAWFLGVVDLIYHLFRWRTFQLWWFFPACLVNIFALKFFFKLKGYETFWMILHNLLSELGWRKY